MNVFSMIFLYKNCHRTTHTLIRANTVILRFYSFTLLKFKFSSYIVLFISSRTRIELYVSDRRSPSTYKSVNNSKNIGYFCHYAPIDQRQTVVVYRNPNLIHISKKISQQNPRFLFCFRVFNFYAFSPNFAVVNWCY